MTSIVAAEPPARLNDSWDIPTPFCIRVEVLQSHMDALGHTNNVHYLDWLQTCAWHHSKAVGLDTDEMLATGCAMAVYKATLHYLAATFAGDTLWVGDWIVKNNGKLRATRRFQIVREADGQCVMRADIDYSCIHVASGKPRRMPSQFVQAYAVEAATQAALAQAQD